MEHKLIAVYDAKAEAFGKPVAVNSHGVAIRSFGEAVNDPTTEYSKFPQDFTLFAIGSYNDTTGKIKTERPKELVLALSLKDDTKGTTVNLNPQGGNLAKNKEVPLKTA